MRNLRAMAVLSAVAIAHGRTRWRQPATVIAAIVVLVFVDYLAAPFPLAVVAYYKADPLLAAWLRLSGMQSDGGDAQLLPDGALTGERLKANGIAFIDAESKHRITGPAGVRRARAATHGDRRGRRPRPLRRLL